MLSARAVRLVAMGGDPAHPSFMHHTVGVEVGHVCHLYCLLSACERGI